MTESEASTSTEEHVQPQAIDAISAEPTVSESDSVTPLTEMEPPIQNAEDRKREELRMLMLGFGTGISIAFVFLIYILFEYAKYLP